MSRARRLGGAFGLEPPVSCGTPAFFTGNVQYFLNVRCALLALVQSLRPRTAWLPSYLCPALLEPFRSCGVDVSFYRVDERLRVADCAWVKSVHRGDFVVVIHYFGMPQGNFPAAMVKQQGAHVIEDSSQALFLPRQFEESLCVLYSPRKFLGVPDSGVMVSKAETGTESLTFGPPPAAWWLSAVAMGLARREYDLTGQPSGWFEQFQRVESEFPLGLYRSSDLSRTMLDNGIDYQTIRVRRRANYQALLDEIGEYALFPELPQETVPLGFPVRVEAGVRDEVLEHLHAARVYAPLHWRIENVVPEAFQESRALALSSLTLVCDQRYTPDDMAREAQEFRRICSQPGR